MKAPLPRSFLSNSFFDEGALLSVNERELILACNDQGIFPRTSPFKPSFKNAYFLKPRFFLQEVDQPRFYSSIVKVQNLESEEEKAFETLNQGLASLSWEVDEVEYKRAFDDVMKKIHKGDIKKAVPYINFKAPKPNKFNQKFLPYIIHSISKFQSSEYLYGFWTLSQGFVGVTPEVLVSRWGSGGVVKTMALAGSEKISSSKSMTSNPKLLEEHKWVIQDIQNSLSDFDVKIGCTYEKTYHAIKHLRTDISFESQDCVEALISLLAPTSALGVYPKNKLDQVKDILGGEARRDYGAPFAFVNSEEFHCVVSLRGLFWDENFLYIPVGGGLVSESTYEDERQELNLKFESVRSKLGLV